jgi:ABC-type multidrug transport system fused ATPase/permease subunit
MKTSRLYGDSSVIFHLLISLQYEALRRVHLIPSSDELGVDSLDSANVNIFRNLDSTVSEGGENFSAGEKQLIW